MWLLRTWDWETNLVWLMIIYLQCRCVKGKIAAWLRYHTMNVIINFEIETHNFAQFIRWSICTSEKTCPLSIPLCFHKNNMTFCYHKWPSLLPVLNIGVNFFSFQHEKQYFFFFSPRWCYFHEESDIKLFGF